MALYAGSEPTSYFGQAREELWPLIPTGAKKILDVGCGGGALGAAIKSKQDAWYCGVDLDTRAATRARELIDDVQVGDAATMPIPYEDGLFDLIIFADILEHLPAPLSVLRRWLPTLEKHGRVVVSLPNVRHFTVTLPLIVQGRWDYAERGILDETHLRFFTRQSSQKLIADAGLIIEVECPHVSYVKRVAKLIDYLSFHQLRDHMVQQWIFVARLDNQ